MYFGLGYTGRFPSGSGVAPRAVFVPGSVGQSSYGFGEQSRVVSAFTSRAADDPVQRSGRLVDSLHTV
jgi:hypothetical protein